MRRCLVSPVPNPITCAVFLYTTLSYGRIICKMIDDSMSAILAPSNYMFERLSLTSNTRLRKHEQMNLLRW
jgi:hypothetical protein